MAQQRDSYQRDQAEREVDDAICDVEIASRTSNPNPYRWSTGTKRCGYDGPT